ncbi:hypothetical protein ACFFX0_09535 [Citricoccus parietis]|uniref:Uncharacterized protein n=1 Tax=Citricoccus parietis TaxID=592307 RepID=A0ABV5FXK6_9MICC
MRCAPPTASSRPTARWRPSTTSAWPPPARTPPSRACSATPASSTSRARPRTSTISSWPP